MPEIDGVVVNGTEYDLKDSTLVFDDTPTANSNNPVKSQGIKTAIDDSQKAQESLLRDTVGWTGKNKFYIKLSTLKELNTSGTWSGNVYTKGSLTFTVTEENGYVTNIRVNGSHTERVDFALGSKDTLKSVFLPYVGISFLLNGCPSGGAVSTGYWLALQGIETDGIGINDNGSTSGLLFTVSDFSAYNTVNSRISIAANASVSNKDFKPMARLSSIADPTYEPYHESVEQTKFDRAEQAVLGAKNLNAVPYADSTKTDKGITFIVNSDGSVTVNGTNDGTGNSEFYFHPRYNIKSNAKPLILPNGKYIVSGCPNGGSTNTYYIVCNYTNNGSGEAYGRDTGNGVEITLQGDDRSQSEVQLGFYIIVKSGQTVNNIVFKPMLRLASDPDDTYVPYAMTNKELTEKVFEKRILSSADDLDNIKTTGIYGITTAPTNSPENQTYGTLIVQATNNGDVRQLFYRIGGSGGLIYARSFGGNPGSWTNWYKFTGTIIT